MIPSHPPEPDPIPGVERPRTPAPQQTEPPPFWNYQDFVLFLAFAFPFLIISVVVVQALPGTRVYGRAFQGLLAQLIWYALVFGALYLMLRIRYGQPFWRSLGWRFPFQGMAVILFGGPLLAVGLGIVGVLLRTPEIQTPFQQMLNNRPTLLLFAVFAIVIGPLCEELAFRGFLMPLLVRSFGAFIGIVGTGALFGLLHAPEYSWSWRHVLLITAAGSAFGWVRYKTGSTAASTTMHAAYNLTQFAAFLGQGQ
ncbi:MAG TPA: type II CAAX endopeptidase family protein [Bryobacteraceae bacterium]|nr:type II CAAX endopeptidase family protein [Bryobacteraceae bacterium]